MYYTFKNDPDDFVVNGITNIAAHFDDTPVTSDSAPEGLDVFFTVFSLLSIGATVVFCCLCCYCWFRRRRAQIIPAQGGGTIEVVDSSDLDEADGEAIVQARVAGAVSGADTESHAVVGTVMSPVPPRVPSFVQGGGGYYYTEPQQQGGEAGSPGHAGSGSGNCTSSAAVSGGTLQPSRIGTDSISLPADADSGMEEIEMQPIRK